MRGHVSHLSSPTPSQGTEEQALLPAKERLEQRMGSEHGGACRSPGLPRSLCHHPRQASHLDPAVHQAQPS